MIKNQTNLIKAEIFIREKLSEYKSDNLLLILKYGKHRYRGYRRYIDFKTVCLVNPDMKYPYLLEKSIGTEKIDNHGFKWVYDSEIIYNLDSMMVWLAGHEIWHYLCKTKQAKYNYETRANIFGFKWVRKYQLFL